jgi:hypothetical protein
MIGKHTCDEHPPCEACETSAQLLLSDLFKYWHDENRLPSLVRQNWLKRIGKELGCDETYINRALSHSLSKHELENY